MSALTSRVRRGEIRSALARPPSVPTRLGPETVRTGRAVRKESTTTMTAQTWGHLAGDTRAFAVDHRFHPDPDPGERDPAEALTWGFFAIYADGWNLCEQHYDGETVERVH